jgi:hypothetical protein
MLPIVSALMQGGLTLLGNAVLAKGKDVVEEKLGVNLESMVGTEAGRVRLKELEMENEEDLRQFVLAKRELELRSDQMYLADTQNARNMQVEALKQSDVFSKRFLYYFSIGWSLLVAVYIGFITFADIPKDNVRFADTILGFLLGTILATMMNFFYGTSKSSQNKDDVIKGVVERVK